MPILLGFLALGIIHARAQSAYSGNYSGFLYVSLSGVVNQPESSIGPVILTIDSNGAIRNGINVTSGTVIGNVDSAGKITFTFPLGGQISSGEIVDDAVTGSKTATLPGLTSTYRVHAPRTGKVVTKPSVTLQPTSQTSTNLGSQVTLNVVAAGDDLAYQWYSGLSGIVLQPIGDATNATFRTPPIYALSNYWVRISNSAGAINSQTARIQVTGTPQPPRFSVHPQGQIVSSGGTITLTADVTGTPVLTYQWEKNGSIIPGAESPTLEIAGATLADSGTYRLVVTNPFGTTTSDGATISVRQAGLPEFTEVPPATVTVALGSTLTLETRASGAEPIEYQWYRRNFSNLGRLSVQTNRILTLPNVTANLGGNYVIIASNPVGAATNETLVRIVSPPQIATQPEETRISVGQHWSIGPRSFVGSAPDRFQWFKNGAPIPRETNQFISKIATTDDAGEYFVRAENLAGSVNSVTVPVRVFEGPVPVWIRKDLPETANVEETTFLQLSVRAEGTFPLNFNWYRDGVLVESSQNPSFTSNNVPVTASGNYWVVANNAAGNATSRVARVNVYPKQDFPNLAPFNYTTNKTGGESVTLGFTVTRGSHLSFQWSRQTIVNGLFENVPLPGATNLTLTLENLRATQAGTYTLVATNFKGSATASVTLKVVAPPEFTTQPESQEAVSGIIINLSALAEPFDPPPTYQWFKNGEAIPLATRSTYSLVLAAGDANVYTVEASNSAGRTLSQPATITAIPATATTRDYRLIADRTVAIPGRAGGTFRTQSDARLRGPVVTFQGITNFPDVGGIYRHQAGENRKVVDAGDSLPGFTTPVTFFGGQSEEESGIIHFMAEAAGSEQAAIFEWRNANITPLVTDKSPIPGRPGQVFKRFGYPSRASGKTAFIGTDAEARALGDGGHRGVFVWDGSALARWADSAAGLPAGSGIWHGNSSQVGFDGSTLAFWAYDSNTDNGVFVTVNGGPLQKIAFAGDALPGGGDVMTGFYSPPVVRDGKVLYMAHSADFRKQYLIEHSAAGARVIAGSGVVIPGSTGALSTLQYGFDYAGDGSILFTATGPGQKSGIYRWRNGGLTPELTSLNTVAGRVPRYAFLIDADGDDCLVSLSFNGSDFGLYATLPADGPAKSRLAVTAGATSMTLTWDGGGVLESSGNLGIWQAESVTSPATFRYDAADRRFFRIRTGQ